MKRYLELLGEANKLVFTTPELKEIYKDFIPFTKDLYLASDFIKGKIRDANGVATENPYPIDRLLKYDYRKENSNRVKTMFNVMMEKYLENIDNETDDVIKHMNSLGGFSCLVGGCVRDICSGGKPKDFDFVTDISYEVLEDYFTRIGFSVKNTGKQFNVLNVIHPGDKTYEIALFRKDGTYSDGRRPDSVDIGNIFEDSDRRDFSCNSLYYDIKENIILDPTGYGVDDVRKKVLRFNGNPDKRIADDYLRVFRAYRFIGKGFTPTPKTLQALRSNFDTAIQKTAGERIKNEIEKMVGI